jgi:hypothetical protein
MQWSVTLVDAANNGLVSPVPRGSTVDVGRCTQLCESHINMQAKNRKSAYWWILIELPYLLQVMHGVFL